MIAKSYSRMNVQVRCAEIIFRPRWLVRDCLEHQPRGQERVDQQLTMLSISHVVLSTQVEGHVNLTYPRERTTTSGGIPAQHNTANSGIRSLHRIPPTHLPQPIPPCTTHFSPDELSSVSHLIRPTLWVGTFFLQSCRQRDSIPIFLNMYQASFVVF